MMTPLTKQEIRLLCYLAKNTDSWSFIDWETVNYVCRICGEENIDDIGAHGKEHIKNSKLGSFL